MLSHNLQVKKIMLYIHNIFFPPPIELYILLSCNKWHGRTKKQKQKQKIYFLFFLSFFLFSFFQIQVQGHTQLTTHNTHRSAKPEPAKKTSSLPRRIAPIRVTRCQSARPAETETVIRERHVPSTPIQCQQYFKLVFSFFSYSLFLFEKVSKTSELRLLNTAHTLKTVFLFFLFVARLLVRCSPVELCGERKVPGRSHIYNTGR